METKLHRIKKAISWLHGQSVISKQKDIAAAMQMNISSLSRALNGDSQYLTDSFLEKFNRAFNYPFNQLWLISGEGEMLSQPQTETDTAYTTKLIPLAAMAGALTGFDTTGIMEYECEKIIVPIAGVDFAVPVYGDSMSPEYPSGTRVLVKRIDPDAFIAWGSVYVLDTTNGMLLKEVQPCEDDDAFITCHSLNPSGRYKDFDVKRTHIRAMYRVLASITMK